MSSRFRIGQYEISITDRQDGDTRESTHPVYASFHAVTQVHGARVIVRDDEALPQLSSDHGDAVMSAGSWGVGVRVADCLPLLLMGHHHIAAVHAGRRGLRAGVIEATLEQLLQGGESLEELSYFVWPCIKTYEVGPEFAAYFPRRFLAPHGEKFFFDLVGYTMFVLTNSGVRQDQGVVHPDCTFREERYFSYRRDGAIGTNFVGVRRMR